MLEPRCLTEGAEYYTGEDRNVELVDHDMMLFCVVSSLNVLAIAKFESFKVEVYERFSECGLTFESTSFVMWFADFVYQVSFCIIWGYVSLSGVHMGLEKGKGLGIEHSVMGAVD